MFKEARCRSLADQASGRQNDGRSGVGRSDARRTVVGCCFRSVAVARFNAGKLYLAGIGRNCQRQRKDHYRALVK